MRQSSSEVGFGGELTTWNGNHLQTSPQSDFQMARSRLEDEVSCNFDLSENEAHFFVNERRIRIFAPLGNLTLVIIVFRNWQPRFLHLETLFKVW